MENKTYLGERSRDGQLIVRVRAGNGAHRLRPRRDLWDHSQTGFEVAYGGSGPAQLALAILADALGDDDLAIRLHQKYKWEVIAKLPKEGFSIAQADVEAFMAKALP